MRNTIQQNKNITSFSKQVELLKRHFPNAFDKEGKFIPHKIEEIIAQDDIELSKEAYSLNWLGKSYARLLANLNEESLLKEDINHNNQPQNKNSENLLIKGDNLEVLKHLSHAYAEKIKMIYIDPPYNTGGDGFVYHDDRKFTATQLANLANIDEDEAERILDFTAKKSNSHSAWLTFMYPRLYIARELLRDDGVIFISIDENEQAQLKLLCDEIFGEENSLGTFIINAAPNGRDYGHIAKNHEYCLFYSKNIAECKTNLVPEVNKKFKFQDALGGFNIHPLYNSNEAFHIENRPNLYYPFYLYLDKPIMEYGDGFYEIGLVEKENSIKIFPPKSQKNNIQFVWRWGKEKSSNNLNTEIMGYKTGEGEYRVVQKMRSNEKLIRSLLSDRDITSRRGTKEVEDIFNRKIFTAPKPLELSKKLSYIGSSSDSIILDFFAGSGTTAHAVMALNAQDGGNRKCISVQIGEKTDEKSEAYKAGYQTIFDITKARIEKAAAKIQEEHPDYKGDLGFKIFETLPIFANYLAEAVGLEDQTEMFNGQLLSSDDLYYLLTTWKLYDGIALHKDFTTIMLGDYKAYMVDENIYFIEQGFNIDALKVFLQKLDGDADFSPKRLIIFGYNFDSKEQKEITDALTSLKNKKSIMIDLDVRY